MGGGVGNVRWQIHFLATHGLHSLASFPNLRRSLRRRYKMQTYRCAEQLRVMAFSQLTYRHSLREIEACLRASAAQAVSLGHPQFDFTQQLGLCQQYSRLANLRRLAQLLIQWAKQLYLGDDFGLEPRRHGLRFRRALSICAFRFFPGRNFVAQGSSQTSVRC